MRQKCDKTSRFAAAVMGAKSGLAADSFVVHAGKTRHGPRQHWRESEYVQAAIQTIHRGVPPRDVDRTKLYEDVNAWLDQDAGFKATGIGKISRKTVERVLLKLQQRPCTKLFFTLSNLSKLSTCARRRTR